jgi:two-component system sensor histidine kinase/response regulator
MKTKNNIQTPDQILSLISSQRLEELVNLFVRSADLTVGALFFVRPGYVKKISQVGASQELISELLIQKFIEGIDVSLHRELTDPKELSEVSSSVITPSYGMIGVHCIDENTRSFLVLVGFRVDSRVDEQPNITTEDFLRLVILEYDYQKLRAAHLNVTQDRQALEQRVYRNQIAMNGLQEGMVEQDSQGKIIAWNEAALDILHMSEEQIISKNSNDPVWGAINEDGKPFPGREHPAMVALQTKRSVRGVIMGLVNPDLSDDVRWIKINAYPYQINEEWFVSALFVDVTEDILLRRELEKSESRWNLALESAHQGVWDWDISHGTLFTSRQWKKMLGYAENEVGDSLEEWSSRIHDEDREKALSLLQEVVDGKKDIYEAHYRMICKNGEIRYHFDRGAVVERDAEGSPTRMIGTNTDESDIVEQKLEYEKVSSYLDTVIDSLPFVALVLDENRSIRYRNSFARNILGLVENEFSPSVLERLFPDAITRNDFLRKYQSLEDGWHEFSVCSPGESALFTVWRFQRFQRDSVLVLVQNVTEERSQRLLLKKMSYALDQTQDGVIMTDLSGVAIYANDSSQIMFGYDHTTDEFLGHHVSELDASPKDLPEGIWGSEQIIEHLLENRTWSGEMRQKKKDGTLLVTFVTATLMVDEQDNPIGMIGTLRDISEEHNLRESLEDNRLKLASIVENLPVGVFTVNNKGSLETYNAIVRELLLDGAPEVLQSNQIVDIFDSFDIYGGKCEKLTLDDLPPFQALQSGEVVHNRDIEIVNVKTREAISLNVVAAPLVGASGAQYGAVCIIEDITALKQIEDAKTEFVSMASHQLRTPLTSLKWNLELLEDSDLHSLKDSQIEQIDEIHNSTYRMIGLVNSLLNVSRIEMGTFAIHSENVLLKHHVSQVIEQFKEVLRNRSIQVVSSFHQTPRHYHIDPVVLDIILENLLSNAIKYSHDGSKIEMTFSQGEHSFHEDADSSFKALIIQVKDRGIGIPVSERSHIFRRLYRASNAVATNTIGTGIGLYMVKKVVLEIGGDIWFETEEGKGTTFYIVLPWDGVESREGEKVLENHSVQE